MERKFVITRLQMIGILLVLLLIIGGIGIYAFYALRGINQANVDSEGRSVVQFPNVNNNAILSSSILPLAGSEIANPRRGPQYYGSEAPPPNWPLTDRYDRFCWSKVETASGQYDFSQIDQGIAEAKAAGYTYSWRIMPVNTGSKSEDCLPQYLKDALPGSFTADYRGNTLYIPDYNDPVYLVRAQALIAALGQRYDSNPNVGWLDMSLYGCWGEWNESCSDGRGAMTPDNRQKLIDMQFQAFPHKRFLMLTDHKDSLFYALNYQRPLRTGIRIDCLGTDNLGGARNLLENDATVRNQWKVAPLYFEYCNKPDFAQALQDIKHYHASLIGDGEGNIKNFSDYNSSDQNLMMQNYKASGYRFELNGISLPKKLNPGSNFTAFSKWSNQNTAPTYQPWHVMLQLRHADNTVAWQGQSSLDLQQPFSAISPGGDATLVTDKFTLPADIAHGNYSVCVQIVDSAHVYAPLALANVERASDGSYCVGSVIV